MNGPARLRASAVAAAFALAGCAAAGPTNEAALPSLRASATAGAALAAVDRAGDPSTPTGPASPSPRVTYRPGDPAGMGAWAVFGQVSVRSADEQAVADAFLRMDQVALRAFNTHVVDDPALASVLQGEALRQIEREITWRIEQKLWTVNQATLNVRSVEIRGSTATVRACDVDGTSEVDRRQDIVIPAPGPRGVRHTLVRRGGLWRVAAIRADATACAASTVGNGG